MSRGEPHKANEDLQPSWNYLFHGGVLHARQVPHEDPYQASCWARNICTHLIHSFHTLGTLRDHQSPIFSVIYVPSVHGDELGSVYWVDPVQSFAFLHLARSWDNAEIDSIRVPTKVL